jgi:hypothetical protein
MFQLEEPEEPVMVRGFRLSYYNGKLVAVKHEPGQKRTVIRVGCSEDAERKINQYIARTG